MRSKIIKAALFLPISVLITACNEMGHKSEYTTSQSADVQVVIRGYESFPTAEGCESGGMSLQKKDCYLLPNGTMGKVVEWNKKYTTKGSVYAPMDMFDQSKVQIINGPAAGKTLFVAHAYLTLQ